MRLKIMKIGSHVSLTAPDFLLGSVKTALSYHANAFMIYTGAPQNTRRKNIEDFKVIEAHNLMKENHIPLENMIVHAPYIINLANTINPDTFELAYQFLTKEIERCKQIGASTLVLHPGSHVKAGEEKGLEKIIEGLDLALHDHQVKIALETMAGKGSELGYSFSQLKYIIDHVKQKDSIFVCMDTCHLHDAGYNLSDFDAILDEFDCTIGLDKLAVIHLNDSKNIRGAKKDRHENIGFGEIGFETLMYIAHHPRLKNIVKILETPYINGCAPYKEEIDMIKNNMFDKHLKEKGIAK